MTRYIQLLYVLYINGFVAFFLCCGFLTWFIGIGTPLEAYLGETYYQIVEWYNQALLDLLLYGAYFWFVLALVYKPIPAWFMCWLTLAAIWFRYQLPPLSIIIDGQNHLFFPILGTFGVVIPCLFLANLKQRYGTWWASSAVFMQQSWPWWLFGKYGFAVLLGLTFLLSMQVRYYEGVTKAMASGVYARRDGLYVSDLALIHPNGYRVRLVPQIGIGEYQRYRELFQTFAGENNLILAQGIRRATWDNGSIQNKGTARLDRTLTYGRQLTTPPSITSVIRTVPVSKADHPNRNGRTLFLNADVTQDELSEAQLSELGERIETFNHVPHRFALIANGIHHLTVRSSIDLRNHSVLRNIAKYESQYELIVPWEPHHLKNIARELGNRGYTIEHVAYRQMVSWWSLFGPETFERHTQPKARFDLSSEELDEAIQIAEQRTLQSRRPGVGFSLTDTQTNTFFGGTPSRLRNESWPRNPESGKPLTFVFQTTRDKSTAPYLKDIWMIRIFIDYETYDGYDPAGLKILIDRHPSLHVDAWPLEDLNQMLQTEEQQPYLPPVIGKRRYLRAEASHFYNWQYLDMYLYGATRETSSQWYDRTDIVKERMQSNYASSKYSTWLAGQPDWIQNPEQPALPFFLQLEPGGKLMYGDAGVIYVFLDADDTSNEYITYGQSM